MYADDTEIYKACTPSEIAVTIKCIEQGILNTKTCMFDYTLHMNDDKTTKHLQILIKINDITITFVPII